MKFEATEQQREVIESQAAQLFVAASAGSGKTRVLVDRYLRLVAEGLRPDQILTITYTRRAAAVMKGRIVERLLECGMRDAAQIAETGPIQTIHGFCERLLRENAVAAGIDPDFEIVDGAEASALTSTAIAGALTPGHGDDDDAEDKEVLDLLALLAGRRGKRGNADGDSPHQRLADSVRTLLEKLRGTSHSVEDVEAWGRDPEALLAQWEAAVKEYLPKPVVNALEDQGTFYERLSSAYKRAKVARPVWLKPNPSDPMAAATHTAALLRLAARAWRRLEAQMLRRFRFDFTLLERLGVELASGNEDVRERLARQYPVVFVDEAQDLNPMQYKLLEALCAGHKLLVGDEKQSIYGFRLADVELFRRHPIQASIEPLELSRNFRSEPGILTFVDEVFKQVWPGYRQMSDEGKVLFLESAEKPPFEGVELWLQEYRDTAQTARHIVSLVGELESESMSAKDVCVLVRKSRFGLDLLRRLERLGVKARLAGGTERYFTRMEVRDVANALRALTNPHDDFSLIACLRSPFAGVSLDAIVQLLPPGRDGSLYSRIRSIDLAPEDNDIVEGFLGWFDPLQSYTDRLSAWEAIGELYARSPYLEHLAKRANHPQLLANARKLLALAAAAPEIGPAEFAERVRETQRLGHREGEAPIDDEGVDAVTIMTIHKAKGLEFPVVVVPETDLEPAARHFSWVNVDARLPMIAAHFPDQTNLYADFLAHRLAEQEAEEMWRVMYVALTRAQRRLCVVIDPKGKPQRVAGRIARYIGFKPNSPLRGASIRE